MTSILPTGICTGNAPPTTVAPINRDLDDWNCAKRNGEATLDMLKEPAQWSSWLKPFLLKLTQENWNRIINRNLMDPKNPLIPKPVGDDFTLYNQQDDYVNVLLQNFIATQANISILDSTTVRMH